MLLSEFKKQLKELEDTLLMEQNLTDKEIFIDIWKLCISDYNNKLITVLMDD